MPSKQAKTDKLLMYIVYAVVGIIYSIVLLSAFQIVHNDYSEVCKGEGFWKIVGLLFGASSFGVFLWLSKKEDAPIGFIISGLLLLILSICSFAGFTF